MVDSFSALTSKINEDVELFKELSNVFTFFNDHYEHYATLYLFVVTVSIYVEKRSFVSSEPNRKHF